MIPCKLAYKKPEERACRCRESYVEGYASESRAMEALMSNDWFPSLRDDRPRHTWNADSVEAPDVMEHMSIGKALCNVNKLIKSFKYLADGTSKLAK
jgi:hypothetical protein